MAIDYLLYLQGIEEGLEDEREGRMVEHTEVVTEIEDGAVFLRRVEESRASLRAGRGVRLEDVE